MATVTTAAPSWIGPEPASQPPRAAPPVAPEPRVPTNGLRTDWVAMIVWIVCFAFMALLHLADLVSSLFR